VSCPYTACVRDARRGAGTGFRRSWTKVDAVVRYADAIATAGQLAAILAAMQERVPPDTLLKVQLLKLWRRGRYRLARCSAPAYAVALRLKGPT